MESESDDIKSQLQQIRILFKEAIPTDKEIINRYGWIIAKVLHHEYQSIGSIECRRLLVDYLNLPLSRPSRLHFAILSAAVKVAKRYHDFRFGTFLQMWGMEYLSQQEPQEVFTPQTGFIEGIDTIHGHMHIFDCYSRHFVSHINSLSCERIGDFVRFVPIIPANSRFKTAIILETLSPTSDEVRGMMRKIRITAINSEKGYAAWELTDKDHPITELLSPLQLSQGETSPSFTSGYINLAAVTECSLSEAPVTLSVGWEGSALIYLKRRMDKQKRPFVARLF